MVRYWLDYLEQISGPYSPCHIVISMREAHSVCYVISFCIALLSLLSRYFTVRESHKY